MISRADNDNAADGSAARPSGAPKGPIVDSMAKPLAKRFYKDVRISDKDGFRVLLDGRAAKTPAKRVLVLPTEALAAAIAEEWAAQSDKIDPATMPLTRFANTAIDAVTENLDAVAADIAAYAGRDLLCYRAKSPDELAALQASRWDPVLDWARETLGARFDEVAGVMPIEQPAEAVRRFAAALEPHDAFRLTALHAMTTLTGSAILALAQARGRLSVDEAWSAAHVDEDYQISLWGEDYEAAERRKRRLSEFAAACHFLQLRAE